MFTRPISGGMIKAPDVGGTFELDRDLKKISNRMRPLHPGDSSAQVGVIGFGFRPGVRPWRA
ncbi:MAG: hypothetical protein WAL74_01225, partial [Candidatus Acidiferrales bacterium]